MKKSYQRYIESENLAQCRCFVAFKLATEDWSVYRSLSIIAIKWIFSPKRLNQNLQTRAWNEEKLPRIHWIRKFWPISTTAFKMATEDWSVYQLVSIIVINWIFSSKRLYQNLQIRAWNEEILPRIHCIRKFWPVSKFYCLQNGQRRLVGLPALVYSSYKLNFFSKMA